MMSTTPKHVAFIMDGNRRWSKQQGVSLREGYKKGLDTVEVIIPFLMEQGIKYGSFFAFSAENWKRSEKEIALLQDTLEEALESLRSFAHEHGVCVRVVGNVERFRPKLKAFVQDIMDSTKQHSSFMAQIAIGYGGMQDVVSAAQACVDAQKKEVSLEFFQEQLQAQALGPVDVLVRTGGQRRLSNFFLWQCAYADLFFPTVYWPSFTTEHMAEILQEYTTIKRSYGA